MTISNGNGKSRTNGNGKKSGALVTEPTLENLPTVDELLAPPNHQEHQAQQPETQAEQQSAEELLRQAKQQTRTKTEPVEPAPEPTPEVEQGGELVTASEQIGGAIAQAGQNLLDSQQVSQQEIIAAGAEDAIADADLYAQTYQAVYLDRLAQHKIVNARSFREQMGLVREHTDTQNGNTVQSTLSSLGINIKSQGETANPLGEVVKSKKEVQGIQLFPKK